MKNRKISVFFDGDFQFEILAFSFLKTEIIFYIKNLGKRKVNLGKTDEVYLNNRKL